MLDDVLVGGVEEFSHALFEEVVFVFEVVGDDAGGDAGAFGDLGDGGLCESVLGDGLDGSVDDLFAADFLDEGWFFRFCWHIWRFRLAPAPRERRPPVVADIYFMLDVLILEWL